VARLRFYGQNGEDAILWRLFEKARRGFYVDVGAFDGVYLSNTKIFADAGWDGICVEALPRYAELCRQNRQASRVVNAAVVGDDRDTIELRADPSGLFTGQIPNMDQVAGYYAILGLEKPAWKTVRVPAITLNEVLEGCPPIDFLSMDIEGGETAVLSSLDFDRHHPRVLLLENPTDELKEILAQQGYRLARSLLWNDFFATGEDVERLRRVRAVVWLRRPAHPARPELSALGYPGPRLRRL
jgi:FkbM family methyltransferase